MTSNITSIIATSLFTPVAPPLIYTNPALVISSPIDLYPIFYGSHSPHTIHLIKHFVRGLNHSDLWSILTQYGDKNGQNVTQHLNWKDGVVVDPFVDETFLFDMDHWTSYYCYCRLGVTNNNASSLCETHRDDNNNNNNNNFNCTDFNILNNINQNYNLNLHNNTNTNTTNTTTAAAADAAVANSNDNNDNNDGTAMNDDNINSPAPFTQNHKQINQKRILNSEILIDSIAKRKGWPSTITNISSSSPVFALFLGPNISDFRDGYSSCKGYCGYHASTTFTGRRFIVVVDGVNCPGFLSDDPKDNNIKGGCVQTQYRKQKGIESDETFSVNRNLHADSMITTLLHEVFTLFALYLSRVLLFKLHITHYSWLNTPQTLMVHG